MERPRKAPAVEKDIADISETDIRVRVIGKVTKKEDSNMTLNDSTGEIVVYADVPVNVGDTIRVFGRPTKTGVSVVLNAEIVQDMNKLNMALFKKYRQLSKNMAINTLNSKVI